MTSEQVRIARILAAANQQRPILLHEEGTMVSVRQGKPLGKILALCGTRTEAELLVEKAFASVS